MTALLHDRRSTADASSDAPRIRPVPREGGLPSSYSQRRLWLLTQLAEDNGLFNFAQGIRIRRPLDVGALRRSFEILTAHHEALRTRFRRLPWGDVEQVIEPLVAFALGFEDLSGLGAAERQGRLARLSEADARAPFDLEHGPLLRALLVRLGSTHHVLLVTMHRIVSDGLSMRILLDELMHVYAAVQRGKAAHLPALSIQYADYAVWQRSWFESDEFDTQLAYWRGRLGTDQSVLNLPTDRPRPATPSYRGARCDLKLYEPLNAELRALAEAHGATLPTVLLSAFKVLLYRYTGQLDLHVEIQVANRAGSETQRVIGPFANTLVLRTRVEGRARFIDILARVETAARQAQQFQDLPFERLVETLQPERSPSHSPLFQVMYDHRPVSLGAPGGLDDLQVEGFAREIGRQQFDLVLETMEDVTGGIRGALGYARDLFHRGTIERLRDDFVSLLRAVVAAPQRRVGALDLVNRDELIRLSAPWDGTETYDTAPVHRLIERQALTRPEAPAVIFGDERLSFGELEHQANRLAHRLLRLGVGGGTVRRHRRGAFARDDRGLAGDPEGGQWLRARGPGPSGGAPGLRSV